MTDGPSTGEPADLRLPSLDALRALDTSLRLGSFERAAEALHITASAVSKRISALEEQLGVALIQRGSKPLAATAQGKQYLAPVREALGLLAQVPLHRRSAQRQQRLRISAPPTFARLVLVPALPAFSQAYPDVELELVLSTPFLDQAGPEAELDIRHAELSAEAGPSARVLMRDHLLPLAAPALLAGRTWHEPADLAHLPLLRTPVEPWAPWLAAAGLDWPEPDTGHRLVDLGLTLAAAEAGQGVALARPSLARQALRRGTLQPVLGTGRTPLAEATSAYLLQARAPEHPFAETFADWLAGVSAAAAAEGLALVSGPA